MPLTADGDYQIQARSDRDFYGGSYTLVVESKQYTMDPDDLASFAGRWYDENWGLFVVFSIGDGWLPYVTFRDFIGYIVPVGEVEFLDSV